MGDDKIVMSNLYLNICGGLVGLFGIAAFAAFLIWFAVEFVFRRLMIYKGMWKDYKLFLIHQRAKERDEKELADNAVCEGRR